MSDPRSTSWPELEQVALENHLTVTKRGKDVSFGMMRQQADGEYASPSKSDTRRGSTLGKDFSLEQIERSLRSNDLEARTAELQDTLGIDVAQQHAEAPAAMDSIDTLRSTYDREMSLMTELMTRQLTQQHPKLQPADIQAMVVGHLEGQARNGELRSNLQEIRAKLVQQREAKLQQREAEQAQRDRAAAAERAAALASQPEPEVEFRSGLRRLKAAPGPKQEQAQQRLDRMVDLDEKYGVLFDAGQQPDAEFEQMVSELKIGSKTLENEQYEFHPAVRRQLEARTKAIRAVKDQFEQAKRGDDFDADMARWSQSRERLKKGEYSKAANGSSATSPRQQMLDEIARAEQQQSRGHQVPDL